MTDLWRYVVRSYEHHFPARRERGPMPLFWRVCHALHAVGFVEAVTEGGWFRNARWHWDPRRSRRRTGGRAALRFLLRSRP